MNKFIQRAKQQLGIERFLLQIHDACFPMDSGEDLGRGSPYSRAAERFYTFAAGQGFDGIQLGPQGLTERGNASPYDGTLFSRNPLNLPLAKLVEQGRLEQSTLATLQTRLKQAPGPASYSIIWDTYQVATKELVRQADPADREAAGKYLEEHQTWLVPDALYEALNEEYQAGWWGEWSRSPQGAFDQRLFAPPPGFEKPATIRLQSLRKQYATRIENYALIQWLLFREHAALRERLAKLGLVLYADLQVGFSSRDAWARRGLFLADYHLGAPPSRTNPEGQPWGFLVFDPRQYGTLAAPGPVLRFVHERIDRVLSECDGLRIDHPHGWVDPWVYRSGTIDPLTAVQSGARLFSSPNEVAHPLLATWAIARQKQIDLAELAYADRRVRDLEDSQVDQYAILFDALVGSLRAHGHSPTAIACEVLSTLPYPIQRVLQRQGLGRFRVLPKLKLDDPSDVYRLEQAQPEDWIMPGTHDTPSIWKYAEEWCASPVAEKWGTYLASHLVPANQVSMVAGRLSKQPTELVHGLVGTMLASRARNVSLFFPDLFGLTERYNQPGVVSEDNWRLRLPADFEDFHHKRCQSGQALDLQRSFEMALQARVHHPQPE